MQFLPPLPLRGNEICRLEKAEMLCHGLAAHRQTLTQFAECLAVALKQAVEQRPATGIGQSPEYGVVIHGEKVTIQLQVLYATERLPVKGIQYSGLTADLNTDTVHSPTGCSSSSERRVLIKLRASMINGCAYCVDIHTKEARRYGLPEQWINLISVLRESPVYDARERAVLGWTDVVTNIAQTGIPDAAYDELRQYFSEEETVKITVAIGTINVWNRIAVGFRAQHPVDAVAVAA